MSPLEFFQLRMSFFARRGYSVISEVRTRKHNESLPDSVPTSFHLSFQAIDAHWDESLTRAEVMAEKKWCRRNRLQLIVKPGNLYFHLEPSI